MALLYFQASRFRSEGSRCLKTLLAVQRHFHLRKCNRSSALEEVAAKERSVYPDPPVPKGKMEPFVKNLFLGKIDPNVFRYPEIDLGTANILEERVAEVEKFMNSLKASSINPSEKISTDMILKLKELGLFKLNIPVKYGGMELTCTEMLRLAETFGKDLSLFQTLNVHVHYVSNIFSFASDELKEKYLPLLASGDLQIGLAVWEKDCGVDITRMDCTANYLGDIFVLSGTKQWVCNGGIADKYLVFAREKRSNLEGSADTLTCLLVDKNAEGITAKSLDTMGLSGYNTWEVKFDNTPVPKENVIGAPGQGLSILRSTLHGKITLAGACTGFLRDLYNTTVQHAINRETFGKPLVENDLVIQHLGEAAACIYALESIAYLTAYFYDGFEDPDCEVEAAIVKLYSSEALTCVMKKCLSILGSDSYLKDKPYEAMLRDALFSPLVDTSEDCLKLSIALYCLRYVGPEYQKHVLERRNPLFYPKETFSRLYNETFGRDLEPKYKGTVYENLHQSLETGAKLLENTILKVERLVPDTLTKWGAEIENEQMNLARLANIAVDMYIATASLARASRSISIGLRNCDIDVGLANAIAVDCCRRIESNIQDMEDSPYNVNDAVLKNVVKTVVHGHKYFSAHPLTRNY